MPADPSMFGNLQNVQPLTEGERERLFAQMKTDYDRQAFQRLTAQHAKQQLPQHDDWDRVLSQEVMAVWNYGREFAQRCEARDLRKLAERAQQRSHKQENGRSRSR